MGIKYYQNRYFDYYARHTYLVVLAWKYIQDILLEHNLITEEEFIKINNLIIWHDNSKISKEEFIPYACRFYPSEEVLSPEETAYIKSKFKEAVKHHKENNIHHYETLRNYQGEDWRCYIIEMICDYIAMGWQFDNYLFEYYESIKEKLNFPLEYAEYLNNVLAILKDPSMHYIEEPLTMKREAILDWK